VTAPTPSSANQIAPSGQVNRDVCTGGTLGSSGKC
jgi:hypothetical protein